MNQSITTHLANGTKLEHYTITKLLGKGGFGITYLAQDTKLNQQVAIKEYFPAEMGVRDADSITLKAQSERLEDYQYGLDKFLEEARVLAQFKHPNIVRVTNFIELNNTAYIIMDYEEGEDLSKYLKRTRFNGNMPETELKSYLIPILKGLKVVHEKGLLHRDIKPGNIYLRKQGEPMLIDFGAARYSLGEHSKSMSAIISAGYAPPEQYSSHSNQTKATDLYAWGATAYKLVTGNKPIESSSRSHCLAEEEPDPLQAVSQSYKNKYSSELLQIIDNSLKLASKKRPQNAIEIIQILTGEQQTPSGTVPVKPEERFKKTKEEQEKQRQLEDKVKKEKELTKSTSENILKYAVVFLVVAGISSVGFYTYKQSTNNQDQVIAIDDNTTQTTNSSITLQNQGLNQKTETPTVQQSLDKDKVDAQKQQDQQLALQKAKQIEQDKKAWEIAKQKNTQSSYQDYLTKFDKGKYITQANTAINKLKHKSKKITNKTNKQLAEEYFQKGVKSDELQDYNLAISWYQKAINLGHAKALTKLGDIYYFGKGVNKNLVKAKGYYLKAANKDDDDAQVNLGVMYAQGNGVEKNILNAELWYEKALKHGNNWAQFNLAQFYFWGKLGKKDEKKAFELYFQSAQQGNNKAQFQMGWMYETGTGTKKDLKKAFEWYQKAAGQNNRVAQYNLAQMYRTANGVEKDNKKAFEWYLKSAKQNYANAQNKLGWMYYNGTGVKKNLSKALDYFNQAAIQGNKFSQFKLGFLYSQGYEVKQDFKKAFEWYQKAANQNHLDAITNLGNLYTHGDGVKRDDNKALELFRKSAAQNHPNGQTFLGWMYQHGRGVKQNYKKAVEYYTLAANQNFSQAQANLGVMYRDGLGVRKDYKKALELFNKAIEQKHTDSYFLLAEMYQKGKGVRKSKKQAIYWYKKAATKGHRVAKQKLYELGVTNF